MRSAFRGVAGRAIHPKIGHPTGFPRDCETGDRRWAGHVDRAGSVAAGVGRNGVRGRVGQSRVRIWSWSAPLRRLWDGGRPSWLRPPILVVLIQAWHFDGTWTGVVAQGRQGRDVRVRILFRISGGLGWRIISMFSGVEFLGEIPADQIGCVRFRPVNIIHKAEF